MTTLRMTPAGGVGVTEYTLDTTGRTTSDSAFAAAVQQAADRRRLSPLGGDPLGTTTLELPAGDILITDLRGLLGNEILPQKVMGLRLVGKGVATTQIIFDPEEPGDLMFDQRWSFLQFENITFTAAKRGCTFLHVSNPVGYSAQNFRFINCTFNGWKYINYLEGQNNSSEWFYLNCSSHGTDNDGAWLKIPASGSDQFLNFWWFGGSHQTTNAPMIDAAKGGSFHVTGFDCSNWGNSLTEPGFLFNLRGNSHSYGVCSLDVTGLRVEPKNAKAGLILSQWPSGTVNFRNVDWSSQVGGFIYEDIISIQYANVGGPVYSFKDCTLAGGVKVSYSVNDWKRNHNVVFEDCFWYQRQSPSDVVTYDASGAGYNHQSTPPVIFSRCTSASAGLVFEPTGEAVWDAVIGYRGGLAQTLPERRLSVRGVNGLPNSGSLTVRVPTGATITGFEWISPAGGVTEADGGTWTLTNKETTVLSTLTVETPLKDGYRAFELLNVPFLANTVEKATLTLTPSNVRQENRNGGMLIIHGYW